MLHPKIWEAKLFSPRRHLRLHEMRPRTRKSFKLLPEPLISLKPRPQVKEEPKVWAMDAVPNTQGFPGST